MKSIIITGVAGLLGSRMADWLLVNQPDYQLIGVDNLSGGYIDNVSEQVIFHNIDLASANLKPLFEEYDIDYVYHFAAYAAEGLSPFIRKFNYTNNLLATANVVNECIRFNVKRLIFTSSMAVYGEGTPPFDENHLPAPIDPYGVAKYACEMDIQIAGTQHQLDWCIIRPHNVYGKNQNIWDKYRNVLGIWMYQKLNDQPFTIFGDGQQQRAFSYIDDCLPAFWDAATSASSSKEIINLGGIKETSILEAAEILKEVVGGTEIKFLENRHEVKFAYPTHQKSIDILNYQEKTSLKDGLEMMWEWAKIQPKRNQFKWDAYELDNGIYQYWK
ncbi:MAG: NAD-dependent epimerase/dehydratase family protein [Pelobium sp.]